MRYKDISGQAVSDAYRRNEIKSEEREVCQVVLGEGFFVQMRVNKPEAPERLAAQRIGFKSGDKYPFGVSNNDMGNISGPVDKNAYLTVYFVGEFRKIPCEFRGY
jgi:hypothetical protein